jgi:uncharacterized membrane protein
MNFSSAVELLGRSLETVGIIALIIGAAAAIYSYIRAIRTSPPSRNDAYRELRQGLGRAILVGLELLVAADIIRTVTIEPTIQSVAVLGLIVLVRTFLSWSLEVEVNGQWPWQRAANAARAASSADSLASSEP